MNVCAGRLYRGHVSKGQACSSSRPLYKHRLGSLANTTLLVRHGADFSAALSLQVLTRSRRCAVPGSPSPTLLPTPSQSFHGCGRQGTDRVASGQSSARFGRKGRFECWWSTDKPCHILGRAPRNGHERSRIQERVVAGLARAKAQGRKLGRPERHIDSERLALVPGLPVREAARRLGIPRTTLQRALARISSESTL